MLLYYSDPSDDIRKSKFPQHGPQSSKGSAPLLGPPMTLHPLPHTHSTPCSRHCSLPSFLAFSSVHFQSPPFNVPPRYFDGSLPNPVTQPPRKGLFWSQSLLMSCMVTLPTQTDPVPNLVMLMPRAPGEHEQVYYSHNWAFWGKQGRVLSMSKHGLKKQ